MPSPRLLLFANGVAGGENKFLGSPVGCRSGGRQPDPGGPVFRRVFVGPRGLRAGWALLGYVAAWRLVGWAEYAALVRTRVVRAEGPMWALPGVGVAELAMLLAVAVATVVMLAATRRDAALAGLRRAGAARQASEGALWGVVAISGVVLPLLAVGAYRPGALNVHGAELAAYALAWLAVFVLVGVAEELFFRGYPLGVLAEGVGFWPAAALLSLLFGLAHLGKPGERPMDIVNIVLIGLFLAFTIRRTGAIWLAMGFHAAFDWMALWVFSAPNGGETLPGRLLAASFRGPAWLTGGGLGPEASVLVPVVLALLWLALSRRYPPAPSAATRPTPTARPPWRGSGSPVQPSPERRMVGALPM